MTGNTTRINDRKGVIAAIYIGFPTYISGTTITLQSKETYRGLGDAETIELSPSLQSNLIVNKNKNMSKL